MDEGARCCYKGEERERQDNRVLELEGKSASSFTTNARGAVISRPQNKVTSVTSGGAKACPAMGELRGKGSSHVSSLSLSVADIMVLHKTCQRFRKTT